MRVPGPIDRRALAAPARGIVNALTEALAEPAWAPGSAVLREAEKQVAFAGGSFGMSSSTAFDVAAFVAALRDAFVARAGEGEQAALARLFEWLSAVAVESYSSSRADALRLRHRDSLERGTPVVMVTSELPAALLVGEPDASVLASVFGRLLLAIVRCDARAVIIDGGGLATPTAPGVLEALGSFARHRKVAGLLTILSQLPQAAEPVWSALFPSPEDPARVFCVERFDDAVTRGIAASRRA